MKVLRYLILLVGLQLTGVNFVAADDQKFDWMNQTLAGLLSFFSSCLHVPEFAGFNYGSQALNLSNSEVWVSTGAKVEDKKLIKFDWSTIGAETRPRKYVVMYRIDPRFTRPQIFIQAYDYNQAKYLSDFHHYRNGQLLRYQDRPEMTLGQRIIDYRGYFEFEGDRPKIPVNKGDVVNITLAETGSFFAGDTEFTTELDYPNFEPAVIHTKSSGLNNKVIYTIPDGWCQYVMNVFGLSYTDASCNNHRFLFSGQPLSGLVGNIVAADQAITGAGSHLPMPACAANTNTKDLATSCVYDKGRGMKIKVNSQVIKTEPEYFAHSDFTGKDFLYYKSDITGTLDISTDWQISGMFANAVQFMNDWGAFADLPALKSYLGAAGTDLSGNFLHFGRYIMTIEIGAGEVGVSNEEQAAIGVEYTISDTTPTSSGINVSQNFKVDANRSGYLWLRVINPNSQVQGSINVKYGNYTGSTWFSDIIYYKIITPVQNLFSKITANIYTKLVGNPTLQRIARLMLTLYILLYGLFFLVGATQITVTDLITRIIKISIILALFGENSWRFFNENLFVAYTEGSKYLMTSVVDATSSKANIFGFVDPIFDKYTNGRIWSLLAIQLLQIHNGLAFFAIMVIYSMLLYFRAILEVIIGYVMAFLVLAVMISLAPFFITFILFEQTKGMFDAWLSTLFNYMIQPTLLLVFFLLIEQMVSGQILKAVATACWGTLIPIEIGLNLNHIGIPINFSFPLPFLPGIPFFIPQIDPINTVEDLFKHNSSFMVLATSSLLFYSYCLMSYGLIEYMSTVISMLTNVMPARQEGQRTDMAKNPIDSVKNDLGKVVAPIKGAASSAGEVFKRKVIDQDYRAKDPENKYGDKPNYGKKIQGGSRLDVPKKEDK